MWKHSYDLNVDCKGNTINGAVLCGRVRFFIWMSYGKLLNADFMFCFFFCFLQFPMDGMSSEPKSQHKTDTFLTQTHPRLARYKLTRINIALKLLRLFIWLRNNGEKVLKLSSDIQVSTALDRWMLMQRFPNEKMLLFFLFLQPGWCGGT